jgi:hypothetical protein
VKLFIKLVSLILVLGLSGPFFLRGPDGRTWLDYRDFLPDFSASGQKARAVATELKELGGPDSDQKSTAPTSDDPPGVLNDGHESRGEGLYRWQDADGQWHFSDQPPAH